MGIISKFKQCNKKRIKIDNSIIDLKKNLIIPTC